MDQRREEKKTLIVVMSRNGRSKIQTCWAETPETMLKAAMTEAMNFILICWYLYLVREILKLLNGSVEMDEERQGE